MLKQLASGAALGFVSMIAMKALCPQCEAVIQFLKTAAQQAARLSKDACRWGQDQAAKLWDGTGSGAGQSSRNYCAATEGNKNSGSDWMKIAESVGSLCADMVSAVDRLLGENATKNKTPEELAALSCKVGGIGNITWQRLSIFDAGKDDESYKRKLLWMNLLGAELGYAGLDDKQQPNAQCATLSNGVVKADTSASSNKPAVCPPTLNPKDAMMLFMCGMPENGVAKGLTKDEGALHVFSGINNYCGQFFGLAGKAGVPSDASKMQALKVYYCKDKSSPSCNILNLGDLTHITASEGYLVTVMKHLRAGVEAIRTNVEMPKETIELMQIAPFPLYQAINAAAVYPTAAADLLGSMGLMVAEQIAVGSLEDLLRMTGRTTSDMEGACLSPAQASTLMEAMARSRAVVRTVTNQIGQNLATQEAITAQIRQINLAIQKQVMSSDMLTSNIYSQGITGKLKANFPSAPVANSGE